MVSGVAALPLCSCMALMPCFRRNAIICMSTLPACMCVCVGGDAGSSGSAKPSVARISRSDRATSATANAPATRRLRRSCEAMPLATKLLPCCLAIHRRHRPPFARRKGSRIPPSMVRLHRRRVGTWLSATTRRVAGQRGSFHRGGRNAPRSAGDRGQQASAAALCMVAAPVAALWCNWVGRPFLVLCCVM